MTKTDLNRAILSRGFFMGYIGCIAAMLIGVGGELKPFMGGEGMLLMYGQHSMLIQNALSSRLMLMATPAICALPYASAFADDHRSGLLRMYLPRCGKQAYIKGKVIATALSGGLALVAGILSSYFITWLVTTPMQMAPMEEMMSEPTLAPVLKRALVYFVCGGFWATVGGLVAAITRNRYIAFASPFVFSYLLVLLCEQVLNGVFVINPHQWLAPAEGANWPQGEWGVIAMLALYLLAMALVYSVTIARRLRDDI